MINNCTSWKILTFFFFFFVIRILEEFLNSLYLSPYAMIVFVSVSLKKKKKTRSLTIDSYAECVQFSY